MSSVWRAHVSRALIASLLYLPLSSETRSQTSADVTSFYANKTVTVVLGYPPGGANDAYARLVTRFIGQFIPGSPHVVLQHMPGAGSGTAANYLYNIAPKDGTVLGLLVPTLALEERLGLATARFKMAGFSWLGRIAPAPNVTFMWHTSPVKTIADAFTTESLLGATGNIATNAIYPAVLNNVLGTKFKFVLGYQGSAAAMLAMERGEVEGHSPTLDTLTSLHPDWIEDKKVNIIVQYLAKRNSEMPDVPTALELAKTEEQANVLRLVVSAGDIGKSVVSTPGLPVPREMALRRAFNDMVRDPEFLAEARAQRVNVGVMSADEVTSVVEAVQNAPDPVVAEIRRFYPAR